MSFFERRFLERVEVTDDHVLLPSSIVELVELAVFFFEIVLFGTGRVLIKGSSGSMQVGSSSTYIFFFVGAEEEDDFLWWLFFAWVGGVVERRASELEWFLVGVCSLSFEEGTACLFFVPLVAVAPLVAVVPFVDLFFCIISVLLFLLAPLPPEDGKDTSL